jgi:altronate dehydratase
VEKIRLTCRDWHRREAAVAATGFDLTGNNPGAENIRGGLSTIEEKSLGAVAKGGTRPIAGVLAIAEEPRAGGLYLMDAPAFSPESLTGFAASGANVMLFTTGAGNSFCNALAPTIKVSGRPDTVARLRHDAPATGWTRLGELIGERTVSRAREWLGGRAAREPISYEI